MMNLNWNAIISIAVFVIIAWWVLKELHVVRG